MDAQLEPWPGDSERPERSDPSKLQLPKIGKALAVCFGAAVIGLAGLTAAAITILGHPKLPHLSTISLHDLIGVLQLIFASVAGAGALVALVVAYRRQQGAEVTIVHDRTRVLNERFIAIAAQFGDDKPAVQLAGVHAMAGLADDWKENRQTCIDVLCAYLRVPYQPDPGEDADAVSKLAYRGNREVRHTAIRVITAHLRPRAAVSWADCNFDFSGVVFDGGDFSGAQFLGGRVDFTGAEFLSGVVRFTGAKFYGGRFYFVGARFSGATVDFSGTDFHADFFSRRVRQHMHLSIDFSYAEFKHGMILFVGARFSGGVIYFKGTQFSGAFVAFKGASFRAGGELNFERSEFTGGLLSFLDTQFSGGIVDFQGAIFSGGEVNFSLAADWSHPPKFDWERTAPPGVELPAAEAVAPSP